MAIQPALPPPPDAQWPVPRCVDPFSSELAGAGERARQAAITDGMSGRVPSVSLIKVPFLVEQGVAHAHDAEQSRLTAYARQLRDAQHQIVKDLKKQEQAAKEKAEQAVATTDEIDQEVTTLASSSSWRGTTRQATTTSTWGKWLTVAFTAGDLYLIAPAGAALVDSPTPTSPAALLATAAMVTLLALTSYSTGTGVVRWMGDIGPARQRHTIAAGTILLAIITLAGVAGIGFARATTATTAPEIAIGFIMCAAIAGVWAVHGFVDQRPAVRELKAARASLDRARHDTGRFEGEVNELRASRIELEQFDVDTWHAQRSKALYEEAQQTLREVRQAYIGALLSTGQDPTTAELRVFPTLKQPSPLPARVRPSPPPPPGLPPVVLVPPGPLHLRI